VFILAGQSNMEGKAPNALLEYQAKDPKKGFFRAPAQGQQVDRAARWSSWPCPFQVLTA